MDLLRAKPHVFSRIRLRKHIDQFRTHATRFPTQPALLNTPAPCLVLVPRPFQFRPLLYQPILPSGYSILFTPQKKSVQSAPTIEMPTFSSQSKQFPHKLLRGYWRFTCLQLLPPPWSQFWARPRSRRQSSAHVALNRYRYSSHRRSAVGTRSCARSCASQSPSRRSSRSRLSSRTTSASKSAATTCAGRSSSSSGSTSRSTNGSH